MAEYIEKATLLNRVIIPSICSCVQGPTAERLKRFCTDTVNNVPAADVAPVVHGHWLNIDGDYTFAACSICSEEYEVATEGEAEKGLWSAYLSAYRYCPNCGAKMDIDEEGET